MGTDRCHRMAWVQLENDTTARRAAAGKTRSLRSRYAASSLALAQCRLARTLGK